MSESINRRTFLRDSIFASAAGGLALHQTGSTVHGQAAGDRLGAIASSPGAADSLPKGRIGNLEISRLLLGGNLLTHFTHSRDLQYVYKLAAHYNTEEKILETLALAEKHGVNTLVIHTVPSTYDILKKHRQRGGKMQWIICPTAPIEPDMTAYRQQVQELARDRVDAIYLWGVRADELVTKGRVDLIAKAVDLVKAHGLLSGVGAHDLNVIMECERNKVGADFYIKTFHHHNYPSAPKPEEVTRIISEVPGYWCKEPQKVVEFMQTVEKPWIAFKVMAAGAIPPANAFRFAFKSGADHVLAGMFDFEIAEDVRLAKEALAAAQSRPRAWRS